MALTDIEIALGILAASSTLYGFSLAYYIFARTLHFQEETRHWDQYLSLRMKQSLEETRTYVRAVQARRVWLDRFLIIATVTFAASVAFDLLYLFPLPAGAVLSLAAFFFASLAGLVTVFLLYVGRENLRETKRDMLPQAAHEEWPPDDEAVARRMYEQQGRSIREIAEQLDRLPNDVRSKLQQLGARRGPLP